MIAPERHAVDKNAVPAALRHSAHRPAPVAQVQLKDKNAAPAVSRKTKLSQADTQPIRHQRHTGRRQALTRTRRPRSDIKVTAPKPAVRLPRPRLATAQRKLKKVAKTLAMPHGGGARPYLPAPNRRLLKRSKLHVTQTQYVCPRYPGFPHIGLDLVFSAHVNRRGRVIDFTVIRGNMPTGYRAALRYAVLQWRFEPLHKDGSRSPFQIIDRVHLAHVGHACIYDYMTGGRPQATGREPRWAVYFISGVPSAPPVAMKH
jgi:hypothetical protein